jgi:putative transposase
MERYQISEGAAIYYVTFTVTQWLPIVVRQQPCMIVIDSLNHCIREKGLLVGAYVLMPTRLHAVIGDREADVNRLARTVNELRRFTGRELANWCDARAPEAFKRAMRKTRARTETDESGSPASTRKRCGRRSS